MHIETIRLYTDETYETLVAEVSIYAAEVPHYVIWGDRLFVRFGLNGAYLEKPVYVV